MTAGPLLCCLGSYVKWAVQEFPTASGGERSEAFVALEECARKFQTDSRYTNDHRFVKIWIQYVSREAPTPVHACA